MEKKIITTTIRFSHAIWEKLERVAKLTCQTKNAVIRQAVIEYVAKMLENTQKNKKR